LLQVAAPFSFGPDFTEVMKTGVPLTFLEAPQIKVNPGVLADRLLRELDRTGAQRLVIDSIAELEQVFCAVAIPSG
jgi:hypothetical protein